MERNERINDRLTDFENVRIWEEGVVEYIIVKK
jgi:hypothetical protein